MDAGRARPLVIAFALCLSACKPLTIDVGMPEAIEVGMTRRIEVRDYSGDDDEAEARELARALGRTRKRMRNRMSEIRALKNNALVGENHKGLLSRLQEPDANWEPGYVENTMREENADRLIVMQREARESRRTVEEVGIEQWNYWRRTSFPGEWVEEPGEKDGEYAWEQKEEE